MQCKIRITKEIADLFPRYCPKFGQVYDAEYIEPTNSYPPRGDAVCVVKILGKRIILRKGEFEIVKG